MAALDAAGVDAAISRADFEASLEAALIRERFDVVIFDPTTPELTRDTVERCIELRGHAAPLIVLDDLASLGATVARVLAPKRH